MKRILKKFYVPALLAASLFLLQACARSSAYRQDQQYYREDSDFASKKGSATAHAARFGQPKKKVFVYSFVNDTPYVPEGAPPDAALSDDANVPNDLGDFAAEELSRAVRASNRAVVPEDLRVGSTSKDFYSGQKVRLSPLIREGKKLGLSIVVVGKIKRIVYRKKGDEVGLFRKKKFVAAVDLEMRVFSVADNKELLFDQKSADSETSQVDLFGEQEDDPKGQRLELVRMAIRNGMRIFAGDVAKLLDKISWQGRVAKISGGRIYVNAGRDSGLMVGDILKVLTPGEDIYDPTTNAYLGRSQGQVKGTLEVVDYVGADGAVTTLQSGGNIFENDVVELY